jgi:hypothetical protein
MADNNDSLDDIAQNIGTVTDQQDNEDNKPAREGDEFDPDEMKRNKNDYEGGW